MFRLDQVPDLYIGEEIDHYALDSAVLFLAKASHENIPQKHAYTVGDYHGEYTTNAALQGTFALIFNRDGQYKRALQIADEFELLKLGMFPSGVFLAFGYNRKDHAPRLVMLKDDGTLLKSLEIPKSDAPESMISGPNDSHPRSIATSQMVPVGHSILVAQTEGHNPLLEVNEGGSVRVIRLKLAANERLESIIPADKGIFTVARRGTQSESGGEIIYEVRPEDGAPIRSLTLSNEKMTADSVACVNDGRFLSIDYHGGNVVPLFGTAQAEEAGQGR